MPERPATPVPAGWSRITVLVPTDALDRYVYAAERRSTPDRKVAAAQVIAETLRDDAQFLPARPGSGGPRTQQEVRETSRERRGGVSAHTEALRVIPPRPEPPARHT